MRWVRWWWHFLADSQNVSHKVDFFFFFSVIFISWRLITLQYCSGFCHTLTWISHEVDFCNSKYALFFFSIWNMFPYKSFIAQTITCHFLWRGKYSLIWCPGTHTSWYLCPFVIPSAWVWTGPRDLLPMDRLWQKRLGYCFSNYVTESAPSFLLPLSSCLPGSLWGKPAATQ